MKDSQPTQDTEHVLAVHESERVRGAMHRSFAMVGQHPLCLASSLGIAKELVRRTRPAAVLLRLNTDNLEWASELTSAWVAPVIFCFHAGDDMTLTSTARGLGMTHFVELPDDRAASWARNAKRLSSSILTATQARNAPRKVFARRTAAFPSVTLDVARSLSAKNTLPALSQTQPMEAVTLASLRQAHFARSSSTIAVEAPIGASAGGPIEVIAMGSSTGGTDALAEILPRMPLDSPCIVIVQHILAGTEAAFARRLSEQCRIEVRLATDGEPLQKGLALLAPSGHHLTIVKSEGRAVCRLTKEPAVDGHRPSVNVLFRSVSSFRARAIGVTLSGMGSDGAEGMTVLRRGGSLTLAQDKVSCVAFGMPQAAISTGGVTEVHALSDLAARLCSQARVQVLDPLQRPATDATSKSRTRPKRRRAKTRKTSTKSLRP